jgi:uncharacterized protein YfcZ (UPF0381/DUF406 family)
MWFTSDWFGLDFGNILRELTLRPLHVLFLLFFASSTFFAEQYLASLILRRKYTLHLLTLYYLVLNVALGVIRALTAGYELLGRVFFTLVSTIVSILLPFYACHIYTKIKEIYHKILGLNKELQPLVQQDEEQKMKLKNLRERLRMLEKGNIPKLKALKERERKISSELCNIEAALNKENEKERALEIEFVKEKVDQVHREKKAIKKNFFRFQKIKVLLLKHKNADIKAYSMKKREEELRRGKLVFVEGG